MSIRLNVNLDSSASTKTKTKSKTMPKKTTKPATKKTTTKPANNLKTSTAAKRTRYTNDLQRPGITELELFKKFCSIALPDTYDPDAFTHSVRQDGRIVASADRKMTVPQSLESIRYNDINRQLTWSHVGTLLKTMQYPADHSEAWVDDVSTIVYTFTTSTVCTTLDAVDVFLKPAVADGQHRNIANVLRRGTWSDIQTMLWYLEVNEHNRREDDPSLHLSHDIVSGLKSVLPARLIDDQMIVPDSLPLQEWLELIGDDPEHVDAYQIPLKDYVYNWTSQDKSDPYYFGVRIGVSSEVFGRCDQNNKERSGGDFIAQEHDTGNLIAKHGIPQETAATLTRSVNLRCKGWIPVAEMDENKEPTGKMIDKRGKLSDGGRQMGPAGYPDYFRFYSPRIIAAYEAWRDAEAIFNEIDPETGEVIRNQESPASSVNPTHGAYVKATTSVENGGGRISDNAIQIALALRDSRPAYSPKYSDYLAELADIATRLRYGVYVDVKKNEYVADNVFDALRNRLKIAKDQGFVIKVEEIVCDIVEAWKNLYTNCKTNVTEEGKKSPAPVGRLPGLDTNGVTPDESMKYFKLRHPGAEAKPAGRPKGYSPKAAKAKKA